MTLVLRVYEAELKEKNKRSKNLKAQKIKILKSFQEELKLDKSQNEV